MTRQHKKAISAMRKQLRSYGQGIKALIDAKETAMEGKEGGPWNLERLEVERLIQVQVCNKDTLYWLDKL